MASCFCLCLFSPGRFIPYSSHLYFRQHFQGTELSGRCPVSVYWDESEPRLFVCETVPVSSESSSTTYLDVVKIVVLLSQHCNMHHYAILLGTSENQEADMLLIDKCILPNQSECYYFK